MKRKLVKMTLTTMTAVTMILGMSVDGQAFSGRSSESAVAGIAISLSNYSVTVDNDNKAQTEFTSVLHTDSSKIMAYAEEAGMNIGKNIILDNPVWLSNSFSSIGAETTASETEAETEKETEKETE
ncbi:MAG: hypothetical protein ACI4C1_09215, partial [Lachnospiraceae bacterium]